MLTTKRMPLMVSKDIGKEERPVGSAVVKRRDPDAVHRTGSLRDLFEVRIVHLQALAELLAIDISTRRRFAGGRATSSC